MSFVRAVVRYPRVTGLAEDEQTNTLHFRCIGMTAEVGAATVHVEMIPLIQAWDQWMPSTLFAPEAIVEYYDLEDAEPRIPVLTDVVPLTLSANAALPLEVSCCISFAGAITSGVNAARRRGRLFLPTFEINRVTVAGGYVNWSSDTLTALRNNLGFRVGAFEAQDTPWSVFSPTTYAGFASYDLSFFAIQAGWVDNEPDTQRRRGRDGTAAKTAWNIV